MKQSTASEIFQALGEPIDWAHFVNDDHAHDCADLHNAARNTIAEAISIIGAFSKHILAADLMGLSDAVQLGQTVWYVKMSDVMDRADKFLADSEACK